MELFQKRDSTITFKIKRIRVTFLSTPRDCPRATSGVSLFKENQVDLLAKQLNCLHFGMLALVTG